MELKKPKEGSMDPKGVGGYIVEKGHISKKDAWDKVVLVLASLKKPKEGKTEEAIKKAEELAKELDQMPEYQYQNAALLLRAEIEKQKAKKPSEAGEKT